MCKEFLLTTLLLAVLCGPPEGTVCARENGGADSLCVAVRAFMDSVFSVATTEKRDMVRQHEYEEAIRQVMNAARQHFGPFWDPRLFKHHVREYVQHQELFRSPPDGWNPKGSRENILLFSDIARNGVRVDLNILDWCNKSVGSRQFR